MKRMVGTAGKPSKVMTEGVSVDEPHTGSGKRVDASIVNNHHEQSESKSVCVRRPSLQIVWSVAS